MGYNHFVAHLRHYVGIVTIAVANQNGYHFLRNHYAKETPTACGCCESIAMIERFVLLCVGLLYV